MKVQIVKDAFGVHAYYENVELVYQRVRMKGTFYDGMSDRMKKLIRKDPVWIPKKMAWFKKQQVFSDRFLKKNFPELDKIVGMGEKVVLDFSFV